MKISDSRCRELATMVLKTETQAVQAMCLRIDESFVQACRQLAECTGRIVVTGIGKSGHIANKLASTMASTGSPAFYLHPAEANHGDFGMIKSEDIVILLSYSGKTEEINLLLPALKRLRVTTIAITGTPHSALGKAVDICLDASVAQEACPLGLAPTASTTASLALGDALAVTVSQAKGFTSEDFARTHPGGKLGRQLLLRIKDVMYTGADIPIVASDTLLKDALYEMSEKRLGMTLVVNEHGKLTGIFTDGDLRRALDKDVDIHTEEIHVFMTKDFHTIQEDALAMEALDLMEKKSITAIPVLDKNQALVGALNIHSLLHAGL